MYRSESRFFRPDEAAVHAEVIDVDLGECESFVAIHPSSDRVFPVKDCVGESSNGCIFGACTTTEEDLILAALVLRVGLQQGLELSKEKRIVVAVSLPIARNLRDMGLLDIFTKCGFEQPAPGCSMCLGIAGNIAEPGFRWLSSQNQMFKDRMGKGTSARPQ
ncbi:uncharacterized protein MYCGRDRAFT_85479 [Zymoseptoria tritici IPO323]|uniref:Aconitase/3-isopropylmalate dehydratase large subunit alpha/beta/alpha domain-containing protein n=1 Tax=Zymoseptoria tritici (strain CBS 115943 / IPO323) TaxID=336722 RepID=F9X812_ZYMTI|nr:uncharacterized protein MYCGRDRAFT_85479 [Zymoseptoria tritici IPO323]EGP89131.1 hypothetical protein MYCGRDRAFT_85479 [Zymoseptoria tritici IPO323]